MLAKRRDPNQGLPIGLAARVARWLRACPILRTARSGHRELRTASARSAARGFTLLELVAVVSIIAVFAALALPSAVAQLRSRRVQEAARQIGNVYREARMRALGRGSAVLVRIASGDITVLEARVGGDADDPCAFLPVSSCLNTNWGQVGERHVVGGVHAAASGEMADLTVAMTSSTNTTVADLDICFTPMGRVFARESTADGVPFAPLAQTYVATVSRPNVRPRQVVLMPNGTARLF